MRCVGETTLPVLAYYMQELAMGDTLARAANKIRILVRVSLFTHTHTHARTHARAHTHTHTHIHTHTHTHTHTHGSSIHKPTASGKLSSVCRSVFLLKHSTSFWKQEWLPSRAVT